MTSKLLAGLACAALGLSGCASSGGPRESAGPAPLPRPGEEPEAPGAFPAPDELAAIARRPPPARIFGPSQPDPAPWKVEQPPEQLLSQAERAPRGFWEELLAAHAARRGGAVRLTEPMACLARRAGRYALATEA